MANFKVIQQIAYFAPGVERNAETAEQRKVANPGDVIEAEDIAEDEAAALLASGSIEETRATPKTVEPPDEDE